VRFCREHPRVLWYADIRGFTAIADATPGPNVVELLNEVFETITATLRQRGGQVLKFMGDGLLATFPFDEATKEEICRQALDAAAEATQALDRLNDLRAEAGKPVATVDVKLKLFPRCETGWITPSRIWASSRSRTSQGRCAPIA
jgi:adenylate cyclase